MRPIHLGNEQWRKARELAERSGISAEDVANRAVDALYESQSRSGTANGSSKSLYDAMVASGSLGGLRGAPADLSTNPEHLRGFGENGCE